MFLKLARRERPGDVHSRGKAPAPSRRLGQLYGAHAPGGAALATPVNERAAEGAGRAAAAGI